MSAYARPGDARRGDRAARRGRRAAARGRHRPRAAAVRAARRPARSSTCARCCGAGSSAKGAGLVHRRGDARRRRRRRRAASPSATRRCTRRPGGGIAAAAQSGHGRGQPRPARALLVLPPSRPDLLAERRRHLLRADRRPPQARARGGRLHLGRARPTWPPRCSALDAQVHVRGAGRRAQPAASLELYARPSEAHRSSLQLAPGELIVAVELPAPPDASAYERAGERAAWSFALTGSRGRALRRHAAAGGDRRHERAARCSTRPIRWPASPASSRPAGSASSRARCASARSPASRSR